MNHARFLAVATICVAAALGVHASLRPVHAAPPVVRPLAEKMPAPQPAPTATAAPALTPSPASAGNEVFFFVNGSVIYEGPPVGRRGEIYGSFTVQVVSGMVVVTDLSQTRTLIPLHRVYRIEENVRR